MQSPKRDPIVHVTEATVTVPTGKTLSQVVSEVSDGAVATVQALYPKPDGDDAPRSYFYAEDVYPDAVIIYGRIYHEGESTSHYYRVTWMRSAGGDLAFGQPQKVERRVSYVPVAADAEDDDAEMAQEALHTLRSAVLYPDRRVNAERVAEAAIARGVPGAEKVREALYALRRGARSDVLRLTST